MNTLNRPSEHLDTQREEQQHTQQKPRQDPRLVYGDLDRFFRELLMEQQEQG